MKVITISGHAQHGKDTTALYMKEILESERKRVIITHYADVLKYICQAFLGWDGVKDTYGRYLLQRAGTDIIRKQSPDFFAEFLVQVLGFFSDDLWDYVLIPDARFENELIFPAERFPTAHVLVIRDGFDSQLSTEQKNHKSETALDDYKFEYVLHNDGSLKDLQSATETLLRRVLNDL